MTTSAAKAFSSVKYLSTCCSNAEKDLPNPSSLLVLSKSYLSSYRTHSTPVPSHSATSKSKTTAVDAYCGRLSNYQSTTLTAAADVDVDDTRPSFQRQAFLTSAAVPAGVVARNRSQISAAVDENKYAIRPIKFENESSDPATDKYPLLADTMTPLCDIYPSSLLLMQHLCYRPLRNTLQVCQQRAVSLLLSTKRYDLCAYFRFVRQAFLLGDGAHIFEPVRELLLLPSVNTALSPMVRQRQQYGSKAGMEAVLDLRPKEAEIVRSICSLVENNVHSVLPSGISESMVSVDAIVDGSEENGFNPSMDNRHSRERTNKKESLSGGGGHRVLLVDYILRTLSVQIHMGTALVDIIKGPQIASYNSLLKVLLRNQICLWSSEILWKKITTAYLPLNVFCSQTKQDRRSNSPGEAMQEGHTIGVASLLDPPQMIHTCASGIQWLLHICKALHSFHLNHLHNTHLRAMEESISRASSVADLISCHANYLQSISECLMFLSSRIEGVVSAGLYAVGRLDEAFTAAEAAQDTAHESLLTREGQTVDDSIYSNNKQKKRTTAFSNTSTVGILRSRLAHTSRAFGVVRDRIKDLISTLDDVTSDVEPFLANTVVGKQTSSMVGREGSIAADNSDSSVTIPWHLTLWYANSLKALIGDDAGNRLRSL